MSLFNLTCPSLVDTFRIGTHILFKISIYMSYFFTVLYLTVERPLPSVTGLETSFYRVFLAMSSDLSIYTHGIPVLISLISDLGIYTHSIPVLISLISGLSIYTHSIPVLISLSSGLSIYTHSIPVLPCPTLPYPTLTFFVSYSLVARTPILPLHFFLFFSLTYTWLELQFCPCISFYCIWLL